MKWVLIFTIIISGGIFWVLYQHLENLQENPQEIPSNIPVGDKLLLNHGYSDGHHLFSGAVKMPHSCFSITSRVELTNVPAPVAKIYLTPVDERLKYTICSQISAGIPFDLLIDAPEDLTVQLFVDGKERAYTMNAVPWNDQVKSSIAPLNLGK